MLEQKHQCLKLKQNLSANLEKRDIVHMTDGFKEGITCE